MPNSSERSTALVPSSLEGGSPVSVVDPPASKEALALIHDAGAFSDKGRERLIALALIPPEERLAALDIMEAGQASVEVQLARLSKASAEAQKNLAMSAAAEAHQQRNELRLQENEHARDTEKLRFELARTQLVNRRQGGLALIAGALMIVGVSIQFGGLVFTAGGLMLAALFGGHGGTLLSGGKIAARDAIVGAKTVKQLGESSNDVPSEGQ